MQRPTRLPVAEAAVSYTHLDVYKRQPLHPAFRHLQTKLPEAVSVPSPAPLESYSLQMKRQESVSYTHLVGGWALNWEQQYVGMVRLMYPFFGGLLLSRLGWLIRLEKRAFWWLSLRHI